MPFNDYNPVVSGLQAGYDIASRIRAAAMQQQQMERLKQQDLAQEEDRKFQREQRVYERGRQQTTDALTEFTNRMKMNDAGIQQATPTDIAEATAPRYQMDEGGNLTPTGQVGTDIVNRMFKNPYGGQTMVAPSEQQQQAQANYQTKIAEGMAASKAGAEARAKFTATAGTVPPSIAEKLGVAPGTPVSQATQEEIFKNLLNPPSENWSTQATDQGIFQVNPKTGASRPVTGSAGKQLTRTPRSASGELTAYQKAQEANRDEQRMNTDIQRQDTLLAQIEPLHAFRLQAGDAMNVPDGKLFVEPKTGKETVMSPIWRSRLRVQIGEAAQKVKGLESQTKAIRQKYGFGEFAPAAAPAAQPVTAPAAAAPAAPTTGKVRVQLQDGRTGTVDAKDFDAKTMKPV